MFAPKQTSYAKLKTKRLVPPEALRSRGLAEKKKGTSRASTLSKTTQRSQAMFTEHASSASPMTAASVQDTISRLLGRAGEANDASCTQVNTKDAPRLLDTGFSHNLGSGSIVIVVQTRTRSITRWFPSKAIFLGGLLWKRILTRQMTARDLEKHQKLGMFGLASKAKVFLSVHVDDMQDGGSQRKLYSDLGKLSKEDPTLSSNTTNGSSVS